MTTADSVAGFSTQDLVRAIEHNLWETWANFGGGPGCALHDEGDLLWFETPVPIIPYNSVIKFQVARNIDQKIDELVNYFSSRKAPLLWFVHPTSSPPDLARRLLDRGMKYIEAAPGMARDLVDLPEAPALPEGVEIREAVSDSDINEFYEFAAWRWGVPADYHEQLRAIIGYFQIGKPGSRMRMWQAWRDGAPIAKIGLYSGKESAGIYGVVTKPEARGHGLASILMIEAMKASKEAGYKLAVLDSSPLAEPLYKRLGFVSVAPMHLYASEAAYL
jgi:ribosomal protein S18 acetylase RimI-like enzyme